MCRHLIINFYNTENSISVFISGSERFGYLTDFHIPYNYIGLLVKFFKSKPGFS